MNETPEQKPKPLMTFVFDEVTVFTQKAIPNPNAVIKPPPTGPGAPILTLEVDEMIEFTLKAINASAPAEDKTKKESA
jgi:hypothetical protein